MAIEERVECFTSDGQQSLGLHTVYFCAGPCANAHLLLLEVQRAERLANASAEITEALVVCSDQGDAVREYDGRVVSAHKQEPTDLRTVVG